MPSIFLGLGSNVGDRLANLTAAVEALSAELGPVRVSPVYETAPMYVEDQAPFLNAVAVAETGLPPLILLRRLKGIERSLGRAGGPRYGPREIDIDLLSYGALVYRHGGGDGPQLTVPHPRLVERRFVLQPLFDVAPDAVLPGLGPVRVLLDRTNDQASSVQRLDHALLSLHRD